MRGTYGGSDGADPSAVPGVRPPEDPPPVAFVLDVDGERFAVRPDEQGGSDYDWVSGPNEGYGFGSSMALDRPLEEHRANARTFLEQIDPATGYIAED